MNVQNRTLFIADNLDIMRGMDSEIVDLIYLDPPFNTKKQYKAPIGSPAEGAQFKDIWTDDDIKQEWHGQIASKHEGLYKIIESAEVVYDKSMRIYLTAMAVRLFEMQRILKPTGSIYLHCDPTASHYLKLVMDSLFGKENFRNEVVWHYRRWTAASRQFQKMHDVMLFYSKTSQYVFTKPLQDYAHKEYIEDTVRGIIDGKLVRLKDEEGNYIKRKKQNKGVLMHDVWEDINFIAPTAKERTGYPTQKPLALLERIIKASSNENDIVLDPFCGCATACVAAEKLQRQWIGIDISPSAEVITKLRLEEASQQGTLFSPIQMSDVTVSSTSPLRTDNTDEIATQQKLPTYQTHKPELFGRQQGRCNGCEYEFHYRNLSVDHIRPKSKGIDNRIENLQLLCPSCNSIKGTGTHSELIQKLKKRKIIPNT